MLFSRDPNTIFRGNSLTSKCIDETMKLAGMHYLHVTLKPTIEEVGRGPQGPSAMGVHGKDFPRNPHVCVKDRQTDTQGMQCEQTAVTFMSASLPASPHTFRVYFRIVLIFSN